MVIPFGCPAPRCHLCPPRHGAESTPPVPQAPRVRYAPPTTPPNRQPAMKPQTTKRCSACGSSKPFSEFYRDVRASDGLHSCCRSCHLERTRSWSHRNPEKRKSISRQWALRHPENRKATDRKRYLTNRERNASSNRARSAAWKVANPEKRAQQIARATLSYKSPLRPSQFPQSFVDAVVAHQKLKRQLIDICKSQQT